MRLTKFTDAGLRAVMYLAVADEGASPATREVAEAMGISYSHMAKVISRLQHLDVVEARRGRSGGLGLTPLGRHASVGWLVRALEGVGEIVSCEGDAPCPLRAACRLRRALRDAQEAFHASLDPLTVAELVASPTGPVLVGLTGSRPG
ncbi:RrF2 family transcriptional regulator [Streptomyces sp. 184]|uniref:RrF2 family transcriptional regulator n=1 Tax=Streptomyces sp. 184 TaxID=1827526 RepID=UPI00389220F1